ncbi:hypothetical protein EDB83DRAFT_2516345 [Lactarius deliciosus]|nr:hypothetical protein EDB83DRAFT_2516345 [Lactarius deliciosus]
MSSTLGSPTLSLTASQAATASPTTATVAAKTVAWQTALGLVVAFVIVAIVAAIIIHLGRVEWTISTSWPWRGKMSPSSNSTSYTLPGDLASTLVRMMLRYFFETVLPPLQSLGTATRSSIGALSRPQPVLELPMYTEPAFREPVLAPPRPAVPRDLSSFRVPSNPYSGTSHSNLPSPTH